MALKKKKTIAGYDYEYWKITEMRQDYKKGNTRIRLDLYKDKETRDNNTLDFVDGQSEFFTTETIESRDEAYSEIKKSNPATETDVMSGIAEEEGEETNWFADAEDVLE